MAQIDRYLKLAAAQHASDVHFSAGEPVRMRVDGDLVPIENQVFEPEALRQLLFEILTDHEREKCLNTKNLDKSYAIGEVGFFRVNIFWTRRGIGGVLRTIPQKIPTIEQLNLPQAALTLSQAPKGLVLVTGPTGSGKSTTLAAMINYINMNFPYHILTAEDPVEFVHESKMSLINQREIGSSCATFADALKYALREDPDVILVGEMRDLETIGLALTAAETGHLVFGTLHTRGAGASVDRIIDSFPANQQAMIRTMLSESLVGVISQALLKRADGSGRVAALEIMMVNHAISNLIREGKTFQMGSIIQTGRAAGMMLMDQHIIELVTKGVVAFEEAEAYMEDPNALAPLKGIRPAQKKSPAPTMTPAMMPAPSIPPLATPSVMSPPPVTTPPVTTAPIISSYLTPPPPPSPASVARPMAVAPPMPPPGALEIKPLILSESVANPPPSSLGVMPPPPTRVGNAAPAAPPSQSPDNLSAMTLDPEATPSLTDLTEVTLPMIRRPVDPAAIPQDTLADEEPTSSVPLEFDTVPEDLEEGIGAAPPEYQPPPPPIPQAPPQPSTAQPPLRNIPMGMAPPTRTATTAPPRPTAIPKVPPAVQTPRTPAGSPTRNTTLPPPPMPKRKLG